MKFRRPTAAGRILASLPKQEITVELHPDGVVLETPIEMGNGRVFDASIYLDADDVKQLLETVMALARDATPETIEGWTWASAAARRLGLSEGQMRYLIQKYEPKSQQTRYNTVYNLEELRELTRRQYGRIPAEDD